MNIQSTHDKNAAVKRYDGRLENNNYYRLIQKVDVAWSLGEDE